MAVTSTKPTIRAGNPHGKPRAELKRVEMRLDAETIEAFRTLGDGNTSAGARIAARRALETTTDPQRNPSAG